MQRPLTLRWHGIESSDAVATEVADEVAKLERFCDRITGCVVTLEACGRHHRQSGSQYRVRIELSVPGGKLVVGRDPPETAAHADLYAARSAGEGPRSRARRARDAPVPERGLWVPDHG